MFDFTTQNSFWIGQMVTYPPDLANGHPKTESVKRQSDHHLSSHILATNKYFERTELFRISSQAGMDICKP